MVCNYIKHFQQTTITLTRKVGFYYISCFLDTKKSRTRRLYICKEMRVLQHSLFQP